MNNRGGEMQHQDRHDAINRTLLERFFEILSRITGKHYSTPSYSPDSDTLMNRHHTGTDAAEPVRLSDRLASELFARLLLELPDHRQVLMTAYRENDSERLASSTHKLLGAVMYCDLPELAEALQQLRQAYGSDDSERLRLSHGKAIRAIDELLEKSGYTGG